MKLLSHEQKDLTLALEKAGADKYFHFVKKKGWVQISHPTKNLNEFSFHRKKATILLDDRFIDTLTYFVKTKGQVDELSTWPEVIDKFCCWLSDSN